MDRRGFVRNLVNIIACPICVQLIGGPAVAAGGKFHWSYDGATGPDNWGTLDTAYSVCGVGSQQSPIDLTNGVRAEMDAVSIQWKAVKLGSIVNNGHTIQVNAPNTGHMELDGSRHDLVQFHFHHRSEHTVDGKRFPMEVHFVHKAAMADGLAVIGVLLAEGPENAALKPIWTAAPGFVGKSSSAEVVDAKELLPASRAAFRYAGSLTTPPCSEVVSWIVYKEPVSASADQIASFGKLFPNNFRPIQRLNRRFILFGG